MNEASPTLEVGFAIDPESSFDTLRQLQAAMDTTEGKIVADAAKIEAATRNMVNLGNGTAQVTAFGNAHSREMQGVVRDRNAAEKAGEGLVRQMQRQAETFGKTASEIRNMRAEQRALAAESQGLTELAARIRSVNSELNRMEAASATAGRGVGSVATTGRFAAHHMQNLAFQFQDVGVQMVMAAQSSDPLRMALMALMMQGSQIQGIMSQAGVGVGGLARQVLLTARIISETAPANIASALATVKAQEAVAAAEYKRTQAALAAARGEVLLANAARTTATTAEASAAATAALAAARQRLAAVTAEAALAEQALAGATARTADASATASALSIARITPWGRALTIAAAAATALGFSIKSMQQAAQDASDMEAYARSLGLTTKEIRNLKDVTVTFGDTTKAVFQVAGKAIWDNIGPAVKSTWELIEGWFAAVGSGTKTLVNYMIGGFVGAYNAIVQTWRSFPAALGDLFYSAVNAAIGAINSLLRKSADGVNSFITSANAVLGQFGINLPTISAAQIGEVENQHAGAGRRIGEAFAGNLREAVQRDYLGAIGDAVTAQTIRNAQDRIREQALAKGYLDPENARTRKPKVDRHAERLARENEAIEAQIRNLYALAAAYRISGAEALIAEARVKAESQAIKQRGDIEMFVNREVRLSIAQRVVDAAKANAALREQAVAQAEVNAMVAAGIVPAERSGELLQQRLAMLPLIAAAEAAQQRGLAEEAARANQALDDQIDAQRQLAEAKREEAFNAAMAAGNDRLAELREELRLVGATNEERAIGLAVLRATREAEKFNPADRDAYIAQQREIAIATEEAAAAQRNFNDALSFTADRWELIARNVQNAGAGMTEAFGEAGRAISDMALIFAGFHAERERLNQQHLEQLRQAGKDQAAIARANARFALQTATLEIGAFGDMTAAAKGFFDEKSKGYKALAAAEKAFRAIEFALSVRAMAQDAIETGSSIAKSGLRAAANGVEAVAKAIASLPFPANLAAGAATAAALAAIGISVAGAFGGGGRNSLQKPNTGTGTVLGDPDTQSASIKNAIDALREVDTVTSVYAREMAGSLRSINSQIGNVAAVLVRGGDINASQGIAEGFAPNLIGKVLGSIPIVGGLLKGLFGSKTSVIASGISGRAQTLESILGGGFDASTFSDIERKKKFLGITTGTKYSTQYGSADPALENQFTLILRSFNDAILAAAGPLGSSTDAITSRLKGFVVDIGKIDLKGLTGQQIEEKLQAVFGAAADRMAMTAFPGVERFQKVGEGAFETLVRVASTVEAVTNALDMLGSAASGFGLDAKMALAERFDSIGDLTGAVDAYFEAFYTKEEQNAARATQLRRAFDSLGLAMPGTLAAFRALVEAQDLTTTAGMETYATLLQLAPAFADLNKAMDGTRSAADIAAERESLQRQILQLQGDTAAIRALDLAKVDVSNRALQEQIYAIQDAQEAAKAAEELRKAWSSVGDSIADEIKRIRGLSGAQTGGNFAELMGRFNAATAAARGGDMDAAKELPGLSQALLAAANLAARSRQELDRVQQQTAASLEITNEAIARISAAASAEKAVLDAAATTQAAAASGNESAAAQMRSSIDDLRAEIVQLRHDNNAGHAATASNTGSIKRKLEDVTNASGGDAVSVAYAA
ncbi:hypothetical protein EYB45_08515 [Erythrobacteraceae bacterium CFH 75059]|uniref:hypothetical protein n=1 Tax=Qipengyuania thermophila TaxID=2509361 RepID=UPI00101F8372|nr:hypothetical protein [Qipengyuania thermophila]TCD04279.1 hypothetical protein EYB45_08515 [Erythrobacteraceae bacterium CFH 75059]